MGPGCEVCPSFLAGGLGVDPECQCCHSIAAVRNSCLDLEAAPGGSGVLPHLSCLQAVPVSPRQCLAPGAQQGLLPCAWHPGLHDPGGFGVSWSHSSGHCAWRHLEKRRACRRQGCRRPAVLWCVLPQSMISPWDSVPALPAPASASRCRFGAVAGGRAQGHHPAPWCDRGHRAPASAPGGWTHSHSSHVPMDSYFPSKNRFHLQLLLLFSPGCGAECPVLTGCPQQSWHSSLPGTDPSSHRCCGDQSDLLGEISVFPSTKKVSCIHNSWGLSLYSARL